LRSRPLDWSNFFLVYQKRLALIASRYILSFKNVHLQDLVIFLLAIIEAPHHSLQPILPLTPLTMTYVEFGLKPQSSLFNYCLWPYMPISELTKSSIPSIAILYESFRLAGVLDEAHLIITQLLSLLGSSRTVFGIKASSKGFSWEFYFYDYAELSREHSLSSVLSCFSPKFTHNLHELDSIPYLMFSVELSDFSTYQKSSPKLSLYLGSPGGTLFGGKSYLVTYDSPTRLQLTNHYSFYDFAEDQESIEQHISTSLHLISVRSSCSLADSLLCIPCHTLCLAHKPLSDSLYFSGVTYLDALAYLQAKSCFSRLFPFMLRMRSSFDYLLLDIGIDYNTYIDPTKPCRVSIFGTF